ncbi:peptidoglycan-binding domain-containing protein [Streptomyces sp. NPDC046759]|uniref:peptidoglycan-binding domain-containing protein n=1 Tax=Streptomyces sp. NPDC046759 TaxID=3155019 RepID=UPI0033FC3C3C
MEAPDGEPSPRWGRRAVLLSVAGAGAAVVAAAGFASGLLSYHPPSRDRAAPEVRESVPDVPAPGASSATEPPSSPAPPRPPLPSSSAPASRPGPSAPRSASPSAAPSSVSARPASPGRSAPVSATPTSTHAVAPVLHRGDHGPQVSELQERLRQLNLYGDEINGIFSGSVEDAVRIYQLARGIRGDTLGEYGPATRKSLEAETSQP